MPFNSSKIEKETGTYVPKPTKAQLQAVKDHVFANIHKLKNVYLAGGEPLLMKENLELLRKLNINKLSIYLNNFININKKMTNLIIVFFVCSNKTFTHLIKIHSTQLEKFSLKIGNF